VPEENFEKEQPEPPPGGPLQMPVAAGDDGERGPTRDAGGASGDKGDPRAKEAALERLHAASDEILAVFEHDLREKARAAGASEQEIRDAQAEHPEHP